MNSASSFLVIFVYKVFLFCTAAAAWWSLGTLPEDLNDIQLTPANQIPVLTSKQQRLSRKYPDLLPFVASGARQAIQECQFQFRQRRWNCSSHSPDNVFGKIVKSACRETSFTYAITSAGVSHSIARACASGSLNACTCDNNYQGVSQEGWQWGGCSDNTQFADKFSRRFVDATERGNDLRVLVNLHNNEAGRAAVRKHGVVECKCHGLSRDCTLKTCWKRVANFRQIGNELKERFDGASMVQLQQVNGRNRTPIFVPVSVRHKPPTVSDLVYYEESPDFCKWNPSLGTLGTTGRECNSSSKGTDGCELLCCDRGWVPHKKTDVENCDCRFFWCCKVVCQTCKTVRTVNTCL